MKNCTADGGERGSASEAQGREKEFSALAQSMGDADVEAVEVNVLISGIAYELRRLHKDLLAVQRAVSKGDAFDELSGATMNDFVSVQLLDRCTQAADCLSFLMERLTAWYPDRLPYSHLQETVHLGDMRARLLDRAISATAEEGLEPLLPPKAGDISWL